MGSTSRGVDQYADDTRPTPERWLTVTQLLAILPIKKRMTESAQVHGMLHVPAFLLTDAGVVKLADARDSKSRGVHSP
jgi:hypothetical protein